MQIKVEPNRCKTLLDVTSAPPPPAKPPPNYDPSKLAKKKPIFGCFDTVKITEPCRQTKFEICRKIVHPSAFRLRISKKNYPVELFFTHTHTPKISEHGRRF